MDLEARNDGRLHFSLGVVERWIVGLGALALIGVGASVIKTIHQQSDAIGDIKTGLAVNNAQLATLTAQLADVPQLTRQIAELQVQVKRNSEDIQELRQVKGIR